jgi:hypothetical protein
MRQSQQGQAPSLPIILVACSLGQTLSMHASLYKRDWPAHEVTQRWYTVAELGSYQSCCK